MSAQNNQNLSIKKLLTLVGVAGASILLSFPVLAQTSDGNRLPTDDRSNTPNAPLNDQLNNDAKGGSQMNNGTNQMNNGTNQMNRPTTTGGGYPGNNVTPAGAMDNTNQRSTTDNFNQMNQRSTTDNVNQMNQPTTTGAGYPGNNVTSPAQYNNTNMNEQGVQGLW